jgi:hypothetical protein
MKMTNKNTKGFWNTLGEIAMDVVDGMAQAAAEAAKLKKDRSEMNVRYATNSTTARAYRQLIETTSNLTMTEKKALVKELATYLDVSVVKETTIIREVETPVATTIIPLPVEPVALIPLAILKELLPFVLIKSAIIQPPLNRVKND